MTWHVVSLCSGVGLFDLGLEWAGMRTVQFCEINPWRRDRLAQRFPGAVIHDDVHTLDPVACQVVATGFPCPPTSRAGRQRAQEDERWIWPGVCDAIRRARPRYVIVENPPGIVDGHGAFGDVLGDLAALGFDAQWTCFSASSLGAPHRRDRLFLVAAHPHAVDVWEQHGGFFGPGWGEAALAGRTRTDGAPVADADEEREPQQTRDWHSIGGGARNGTAVLTPDAHASAGRPGAPGGGVGHGCAPGRTEGHGGVAERPASDAPDAGPQPTGRQGSGIGGSGRRTDHEVGREGPGEARDAWWWRLVGDHPHPFGSWGVWSRRRPPVPFVRRVDDGSPERVDRSERCEALGDAVVPQQAELVGLRLRQLDEVA